MPPFHEPDPLILWCIEETFKDPRLRKKINYYTRKIGEAIAERLDTPSPG